MKAPKNLQHPYSKVIMTDGYKYIVGEKIIQLVFFFFVISSSIALKRIIQDSEFNNKFLFD